MKHIDGSHGETTEWRSHGKRKTAKFVEEESQEGLIQHGAAKEDERQLVKIAAK